MTLTRQHPQNVGVISDSKQKVEKMPTNKSTMKRLRNSKKAQLRNKMVKSSLKTIEKKFNTAIESADSAVATDVLNECFSQLDKACKKGVIHINKAANKKGRLNKRLNSIKK
jgi:small subunit ribosomal protein S20